MLLPGNNLIVEVFESLVDLIESARQLASLKFLKAISFDPLIVLVRQLRCRNDLFNSTNLRDKVFYEFSLLFQVTCMVDSHLPDRLFVPAELCGTLLLDLE